MSMHSGDMREDASQSGDLTICGLTVNLTSDLLTTAHADTPYIVCILLSEDHIHILTDSILAHVDISKMQTMHKS